MFTTPEFLKAALLVITTILGACNPQPHPQPTQAAHVLHLEAHA